MTYNIVQSVIELYFVSSVLFVQIFNRLATTEFFKRTKSNLIYFDLLYKKEKYSQIIDDARVHIELMHNDKQWKLSRAISLVIYAACYKQVIFIIHMIRIRQCCGRSPLTTYAVDHIFFRILTNHLSMPSVCTMNNKSASPAVNI